MRGFASLRRWGQGWATRRIRRQPGPVRVGRRHLYILPSGYGLVYALMLLVVLLGAINYSNNMSFAVCFLLAGLGLVAMHHTHRNLLGLRVAYAGTDPVFAGHEATFRMRIGNPGRLRRHGIALESPGGDADLLDVPAGQSALAGLRVPAAERGILRAPRFVLSTRQPLGLFHAWSWIDLQAQCLVYPAPARDAPALRPPERGREGYAPGRRRGREDFDGLRKYHPGDSFRHVAWKAVARHGEVMTKLFLDAADRQCWLSWDAVPGRPVEERLQILCRWVLDCEASGLEYGLALPGRELGVGRGPAHRDQCLRALALFPGPEARS